MVKTSMPERRPFSWQCPYCNKHTTITSHNNREIKEYFDLPSKTKLKMVHLQYIVCPNPECGEFCLEANLHSYKRDYSPANGSVYKELDIERKWRLVPSSIAKPLPDYIPVGIVDDYKEACEILTGSPKASATLSRRCLQGMIRDFWGILNKKNLFEEVSALQNLVTTDTWEAIDAVRSVGNIGAHMERNIDHIVDVDEGEAELLIKLIEDLLEDWYVHRHERKKRLDGMKVLAETKKKARRERH